MLNQVQQGQHVFIWLNKEWRAGKQSYGNYCGMFLLIFAMQGGFSLYAARGGATEVTSLDISSHALESAVRNFQHNSEVRFHCTEHFLWVKTLRACSSTSILLEHQFCCVYQNQHSHCGGGSWGHNHCVVTFQEMINTVIPHESSCVRTFPLPISLVIRYATR